MSKGSIRRPQLVSRRQMSTNWARTFRRRKPATVTLDQILDLDPCWGEHEIREIAATRESWTLEDILRLEDVSDNDRIWVAVRLIPEAKTRKFARWCALRVAHFWDCPPVVRQYLETGDGSIRVAARSAMWAAGAVARDTTWAAGAAARSAMWAAVDVAGAVARDTTWAARAAASDTAWSAALDAAGAVGAAARAAARDAGAATRDTAWVAERQAQIDKLVEIVRERC